MQLVDLWVDVVFDCHFWLGGVQSLAMKESLGSMVTLASVTSLRLCVIPIPLEIGRAKKGRIASRQRKRQQHKNIVAGRVSGMHISLQKIAPLPFCTLMRKATCCNNGSYVRVCTAARRSISASRSIAKLDPFLKELLSCSYRVFTRVTEQQIEPPRSAHKIEAKRLAPKIRTIFFASVRSLCSSLIVPLSTCHRDP